MKIQEKNGMQGQLRVQLRSRAGEMLRDFVTPNAIVNSGRRMVAEMFANGGIPEISQIAVGTGTAAPAPTDASLGAELPDGAGRKDIETIDISDPAPGEGRVRVTVSATFGTGEANAALSEAGLFNSAGSMYNRVQFETITKTEEFQLTLVWEIIF